MKRSKYMACAKFFIEIKINYIVIILELCTETLFFHHISMRERKQIEKLLGNINKYT